MSAAIEQAAKASGLELQIFSTGGPNDFDDAFAAMIAAQAGALIVLPRPMFYLNYRRLVDLAARNKLPTMYVFREAVEAGGLICYGPDIPDLSRFAGKYVGKILKGAKPSDLPVEEPVKFEFSINLKTAKALGLTIPTSLLLSANAITDTMTVAPRETHYAVSRLHSTTSSAVASNVGGIVSPSAAAVLRLR